MSEKRVQQKKEWRSLRLAQAQDFLGAFCVHCLPEHNANGTQFDHIDPSTKLFNISYAAHSVDKGTFWAEVAKCQLLCWKHHNEKCMTDGSRTKRGEDNGQAKLSEIDVKAIRELHLVGQSQVSIAREFEVSTSIIYQIVHRKKWKHIP